MSIARLVVALICAGGCAGSLQHRLVHAAARTSEVLAVGSLACDGGSTVQFRDHGFLETNAVLGDQPSTGRVVAYIATISGLVVAANRVLPDWASTVMNVAVLAVEVDSVRWNMVGVGTSLCGIGKGGPWDYEITHVSRQ